MAPRRGGRDKQHHTKEGERERSTANNKGKGHHPKEEEEDRWKRPRGTIQKEGGSSSTQKGGGQQHHPQNQKQQLPLQKKESWSNHHLRLW